MFDFFFILICQTTPFMVYNSDAFINVNVCAKLFKNPSMHDKVSVWTNIILTKFYLWSRLTTPYKVSINVNP